MRALLAALLLATMSLTMSCTADAPDPTASPQASAQEPGTEQSGSAGPTPASSNSPATPSSTAERTSTANSTARSPTPAPRSQAPRPAHPTSVQALIEKTYNGRDLKMGRLLDDFGSYKRYLITYRSENLTISGVMNVPDGNGPFPVLVLNHGYINPQTYFPGQGMPREHDYLARQGFVVLHTDYRGHATSDNDRNVDYELRLPYTVDTINAVVAVKASKLRFLDRNRVGWLGRSMGGSVTLNALVAKPGLVDAAVIYASTSSLAADNWRQFNRDNEDQRVNRRIARTYGLPDRSPQFWRAASPRDYFDRVTEPLLVLHGTADDTCPIEWSQATVKALRSKGKDVTFVTYRGEGHTFERQWQRSIERTVAFFRAHLR